MLVKKICITKLTPNKVLKNSHLTFKSNNSKRIIDSSFKKICGANFGVIEYKQIVKKFNFIIIRNIPVLNEEKKDLIARFITLIDHIYDEKKFLSISSNYGIDKIFKANTKKFEYKRTYLNKSRIIVFNPRHCMQFAIYLCYKYSKGKDILTPSFMT